MLDIEVSGGGKFALRAAKGGLREIDVSHWISGGMFAAVCSELLCWSIERRSIVPDFHLRAEVRSKRAIAERLQTYCQEIRPLEDGQNHMQELSCVPWYIHLRAIVCVGQLVFCEGCVSKHTRDVHTHATLDACLHDRSK